MNVKKYQKNNTINTNLNLNNIQGGSHTNNKGKLEYEGEYLNGKKWNGKGYDEKGNIIYELKNGNGNIKEYNDEYGYLEFEGEYLNGKKWTGKRLFLWWKRNII